MGTINVVPLTCEPVKNERNEARRGLAFSLAEHFDWTTLVAEDIHRDYGKRRYQALGLIGEHLHILVFTTRGTDVQVISLRRAYRCERTRHAAQTGP